MPPTDADPWADLYADLGVGSRPAKPASSFLPSDDLDNEAGESPEEVTASEPDSPEGEAGAGGDGDELGEDGQPKRRRRRRRRRGGAGRRADGTESEGEGAADGGPGGAAPLELGEPLGAGFDSGEESEDFDAPPPPSPRRRQPVVARVQDDEDDADEEGADFAGGTQATVPTQSEWKVPSWAEIVRGLYRPDRHER